MSYSRVGSDAFSAVSQPMVSRYIAKYSEIIADRLGPIYVRFPITENEITATKLRFEELFNFPGVIGVVDGTHVGLSAVPSDLEIAYVNRRQYHSINAQIICNADLLITNINARFPGATHDSFIFRNSRVSTFVQHYHVTHEDEWTWLLGNIH